MDHNFHHLKRLWLLSLVLPLSATLSFYENGIIPLYGAVPTRFQLRTVVFGASLIVALCPANLAPWNSSLIAACIYTLTPKALYWIAALTARRGDPYWGPFFTHSAVAFPLIFVTLNPVIEKLSLSNVYPLVRVTHRLLLASFLALISLQISSIVTQQSKHLSRSDVSENDLFTGLSAICGVGYIILHPLGSRNSKARKPYRTLPVSSFTLAQRRMLLVGIYLSLYWSLHRKFYSPVLRKPLRTTFQHPSYPLHILYSVSSVTGLIVVGQALPMNANPSNEAATISSVRYMRAAHSLLGGVWTHDRVMVIDPDSDDLLLDSFGSVLGDSIYGVFVLQEAARLVNNTQEAEFSQALIIGLGAAISANAFVRHGVSTSVVEIDPAVYEAAKLFFGLPELGDDQVFIEDARTWAAERATQVNSKKLYDLVVHDCFSGGGIPEQLYSIEFWNDLRKILKPAAVVVVNFVGRPISPATKHVLFTLERALGPCRAFHDLMDVLIPEKYEEEFINIVFFCSLSSEAVTFREPRLADYLNSPLRRHMLGGLAQREVDLSLVRDWNIFNQGEEDTARLLLTDLNNPLGKLQENQGHFHWKLMRGVMPDIFWETY